MGGTSDRRPVERASVAEASRLSVTIIARDEEDRLGDALASVAFADEVVVVVDAASSDRTEMIARASGAKVIVRKFRGFGDQKNAAQDAAQGPWILSLDADEIVSAPLAVEIRSRLSELARNGESEGHVQAFRIPILLEFLGRPLRFGRDTIVRPIRLYHRNLARFSADPIHERVLVRGRIDAFDESILHHSYRNLSHYLEKLNLYTTLAAESKRRSGQTGPRFLSLRVAWEFLDRAILRLAILDGAPGLTFAVLSAANTLLKYLKLAELVEGERAALREPRR
jgi:glycosyltransferase involved in cell wall biosynthesis